MTVSTPNGDSPILYANCGATQFAMLHHPARPGRIGVIIVPAGYQYRVGPYRQHVLIARTLGVAGIPSLRIDPPAIGDSGGTFRDFEMGDAVNAAIDAFFAHCPSLESIVLWGICGSATLVAMHVPGRDRRVRGLILVNPWIRARDTIAKTYIRHYYAAKLTDRAFWTRLLSGRVRIGDSLRSFLDTARSALRRGTSGRRDDSTSVSSDSSELSAEPCDLGRSLSDRMADGLEAFGGRTLVVLSGADLTAREFADTTAASSRWHRILGSSSVDRLDIPGADHIFSDPALRTLFFDGMVEWVKKLEPAERRVVLGATTQA